MIVNYRIYMCQFLRYSPDLYHNQLKTDRNHTDFGLFYTDNSCFPYILSWFCPVKYYFAISSANLAKGFFIANASSTTITVTIKNKPKAFPSRISNKPPYIACPMGVAHIPIHMAQDITFPIRLPGTIICKYDMICIEKNVARSIITKQLTIMIP